MKKHKLTHHKRDVKGFTLIEMLVVIAIIGILTAIIMPALKGARTAARKAEARQAVKSIVVAVKYYPLEYHGAYPEGNDSGADTEYTAGNSSLMRILIAENDDGANEKEKVFLEAPVKYLRQETGWNYLDPWGNPYQIVVDTDRDGTVTGPSGEIIKQSVIAWSLGHEDPPNQESYIRSW